jgi:cysteine desulfurase
MNRIYLDHNASAPVRPEAARARAATETLGNPSSIHREGREARERLDEARERLSALLHCRPRELVFTSGGSEANALALWGAFLGRRDVGRTRVLASAIEHPSVLSTLKQLDRVGARLQLLPVGAGGRLDLDRALAALGPDVALVSLMLANNETGVVQPVAELARAARAAGAGVHCDAVQAAGRLQVEPRELQVDLLSLSGHKFGAGMGSGLLYVRDGLSLAALAAGHQEGGRRAGTETVGSHLATAAALEAAERDRAADAERLSALRQRLEDGLLALPGTRLVGTDLPRLSNTANICFDGAAGEALVIALDLAGIAASSGAACASGTLEPSHVLLAMGIEPELARSSLRFSLGPGNTVQEIERLLDLFPPILEAARRADA